MADRRIVIPRVSTTNVNNNKMDNHNNYQLDDQATSSEIKPKKLLNPCKEDQTRINLHKELLFNQKIGKQVLNKKSELEKAVEKVQNKKNELGDKKKVESTEFQKVLEERAKLIENNSKETTIQNQQPEFFKIHQKIIKK